MVAKSDRTLFKLYFHRKAKNKSWGYPPWKKPDLGERIGLEHRVEKRFWSDLLSVCSTNSIKYRQPFKPDYDDEVRPLWDDFLQKNVHVVSTITLWHHIGTYVESSASFWQLFWIFSLSSTRKIL